MTGDIVSGSSTTQANVGLVGTGLFGTALAERLLANDFAVKVHNRTHAKADPPDSARRCVVGQSTRRMSAGHILRVYHRAGCGRAGADASRTEAGEDYH
jgi:hypothetical protein